MTGYAARDEILLAGRKVGDTFCRRGGVGPGPCGELVDEVVACEDELFGCHLTGVAEGGGVGNGRPAVAKGIEGGVDDVHSCSSRGAVLGDSSAK